MIYTQEILKATLETLSRDELLNLINTLKEKTGNDYYAECGLEMTIETAEQILMEYNQLVDEAHDED